MRNKFYISVLTLSAVLFTSCSSYRTSIDVSGKIIDTDEDNWLSMSIETSKNSKIPDEWWKIFKDDNLSDIMEIFVHNNYDLKLALLSFEASKSMAIINGASIYPDVNVGMNNSIFQQNTAGTPYEDITIHYHTPEDDIVDITIPTSSTNENHSFKFSSQWEMDLWGKLSSKSLSANKDLESKKNEYDFLKLSLISQAVKTYFNLVESNEQVALAESSVEAYEEIFNIVEERYNQGVRSSLDYRLALSNLLLSKATLEQRKMILDNLKRQMETLMGQYPTGKLTISDSLSKFLPPIPSNIPSDIIKNRPDIVSSYNKIESAAANLDYAIRMKFPSFSLTSSIGTSSSDLTKILNGDYSVWSVGTNLILPLFQNQKLKANENLSRSLFEQAEINYIHTVLRAFSEIENKLSISTMLKNQLSALDSAYVQTSEAYQLAKDRYDKGLADLITVLDSQKRMFDTKSQMILVEKALIENRVDLLICLGGDFSD